MIPDPILDNFGGTLSGWTTPAFGDAALTITGGTATSSSPSLYGGGYWNTIFSPNQYAFVTASVLPAAGEEFYVNCRCTDTTGAGITNYHIRITPSTGAWGLRRWVAGVSGTIASGTQAFSAGDSLGIMARDTTISGWYKSSGGVWVQLGSGIDSNIPATSGAPIGMEIQNNTGRLDDFGGGPIPGAVGPIDFSNFPKQHMRGAA